jgi:hypothetical protein
MSSLFKRISLGLTMCGLGVVFALPPGMAAADDQSLADAGWTVYGSYQAGWGIAVISALARYDGMCRPMGFQDFVFVDGVFAGTLSPEPMDSRTDGARDVLNLLTADHMRSVFLRYRAGDPACCPSSKSSVLYGVDRSGSAPVVVPQSD